MSDRNAPALGDGLSAFLYDAGGSDRDVTPDAALVEGLADDDLLWIDVDASREGAVERAAGLVPLEAAGLARTAERKPFIHDFGEAFVLGVLPPLADGAPAASETLVRAVGSNWLVTVHEGEVESLREFGDHLRGDSVLGRLDAASFLARLLEWVVNAYFDRVDELQQKVDELEVSVLRERAGGAVVEQLVDLRHEVGRLRRRLAPHRQVFSTLSHPSFDVISGSEAAREFDILSDRLEMAVHAVDTTREMIVGALDVFMTQTAQRTNDVMRVLTTVSVVLLPATVTAGIFGMNMLPKYLLHSWVYWAALAFMFCVSGGLLLGVRARFWR